MSAGVKKLYWPVLKECLFLFYIFAFILKKPWPNNTMNFLTLKINLCSFLPLFLLQCQPFDVVAGEYGIRIFHSYSRAHTCWIFSDKVFSYKSKGPMFWKDIHWVACLTQQTISHPVSLRCRKVRKTILPGVKEMGKTPAFCHIHIVFITVACF